MLWYCSFYVYLDILQRVCDMIVIIVMYYMVNNLIINENSIDNELFEFYDFL